MNAGPVILFLLFAHYTILAAVFAGLFSIKLALVLAYAALVFFFVAIWATNQGEEK